jgi:hypothetical protein
MIPSGKGIFYSSLGEDPSHRPISLYICGQVLMSLPRG